MNDNIDANFEIFGSTNNRNSVYIDQTISSFRHSITVTRGDYKTDDRSIREIDEEDKKENMTRPRNKNVTTDTRNNAQSTIFHNFN